MSNEKLLKDLRGTKCPLNFIKAKVFLEDISSDKEVTFLLDDNESIDNVPNSLEREGHVIISSDLKKNNDRIYWELKVKK